MSVPGSTGRKGAYGWVLLIGVALVAGGLVRAGIIRVPGHDVLGANKVILKIAKDTTPIALGNFKNGFSSVIDPVLPAVVNISSTKIVKQQQMQDFDDPFFRQFFGNQFPSPRPRRPNASTASARESLSIPMAIF